MGFSRAMVESAGIYAEAMSGKLFSSILFGGVAMITGIISRNLRSSQCANERILREFEIICAKSLFVNI